MATQPTYKRQRFLLSFVRQLSDGVKATDLQKLVFLHTKAGDSSFYQFVPFRYGAYSFQLAEDLAILQKNGYLRSRHQPDGQGLIISATAKVPTTSPTYEIAPERGDTLLRLAYRQYPYYAINSEIVDRLFNENELAKFREEKQAYAQRDQALFTIGYEGRTIENVINTLLRNNVQLLCDVRKNALSRKFGFSKRKLAHITEAVGIHYVHLPGLGIETEKRRPLESREDYQVLFKAYEKTLPEKQEYLAQVDSLLKRYSRLALMCFEREANMCHRHVIRDYLVETNGIMSGDL